MSVVVRSFTTLEMGPDEAAAMRALLDAAFGTGEDAFGDLDWEHVLGGLHVVAAVRGEIVACAAVVRRVLEVDGRPLRTGYVEAVATRPDVQGTGLGTAVMEVAGEHIRSTYELGALATGAFHFYERLGWERWRGPTAVRTPTGLQRTPDEDGYMMILRTRWTPPLDPAGTLSCEWRPGDVW